MSKFTVEVLTDSHECEEYGTVYAEGYEVRVGGKLLIKMEPAAYCLDGATFTERDLLKEILSSLGHEVEFV